MGGMVIGGHPGMGGMVIGGHPGMGGMIMSGHPVMVRSQCRHCFRETSERADTWDDDLSSMPASHAVQHSDTCPRRRGYEASRERAEREERERRERERLGIARARFSKKIGGTTVAPTRPSVLGRRFEEQEAIERQTLALFHAMQSSSPYPSKCVFESLLTPSPTGQAIVFKGTYRGTTPVAIKMFKSESPAEYNHEVSMFRALPKHTNIISLTDALDDGRTRRSIIFPLAQMSLESYYERNGVLPTSTVKQLFREVAAGLAHMHISGFVHLDMKCGNVLLDSSNKCMITDLGMTQQVTGRQDVIFKGTYPFMAPEVWNVTKNCDLT